MRDHEEFTMNLIGRRPWAQSAHDGQTTVLAMDKPARKRSGDSRAESVATVRGGAKSTLGVVSRVALIFAVAIAMLAAPVVPASAAPPEIAIGVAVSFGPPPLPYYAQPLCPGPGYIWTPGYWAWDPYYGYYWVPGTWVVAPFEGALWTPGYWGWDADGDDFVWYPGYWGPVVGFYGGIDYGYGYNGYGYDGGYWRGGTFFYNRTVNNIRTSEFTHVYAQRVESRGSRISYNGGRGGIEAHPTRVQIDARSYRRSGEVGLQVNQREMARSTPRQRASVNHGRPAVAATQRPGAFTGQGAVEASRAGGHYVEPDINRAQPRSAPQTRSKPAPEGNWQKFNRPPERTTPPQRAERPAREQNGRWQPPAVRPEHPEYRSNSTRQPTESRPTVNRQAPPPRHEAQPAPRGRGEGNAKSDKPHGDRGEDNGNPHGQHR